MCIYNRSGAEASPRLPPAAAQAAGRGGLEGAALGTAAHGASELGGRGGGDLYNI